MLNIMEIDGHKAIISYDPGIELFRGEFVGLNGGADFYGADVASLQREARLSLQTYFDVCRERGIEPYKQYSGRFNVRISPETHAEIVAVAMAEKISLNEWVNRAIVQAIHA